MNSRGAAPRHRTACAVRELPDPDSTIGFAGGEPDTGGIEREMFDLGLLGPSQRADLLLCRNVPIAELAVISHHVHAVECANCEPEVASAGIPRTVAPVHP